MGSFTNNLIGTMRHFLAVMAIAVVSVSALPRDDIDYNDVGVQGDMELALQEYLEQLLSQRPDVREELEHAVEQFIAQNIQADKQHALRKRSPTIIATAINATKKKTCLLSLGLFCIQLIG